MAIATKNKKRCPKKSSRVICSKRGCNNKARTRGLCERHCANRPNCKVEGCTTRAQSGCEGLCKRHRAIAKSGSNRPTCNVEGCKYWAQEGGICQKHGGKRVNPVKECSIDGCTKFAQSGCGKMCRRHHSISKSGNSADEPPLDEPPLDEPIISEKKQSVSEARTLYFYMITYLVCIIDATVLIAILAAACRCSC